ncbi:hypothetical protein [Bdellovibrio reynosensis]|uniref:Uncharacterized protein n=1 Tax=Bdellovibrio reynosensis TaxID=2835041 RepID=A0ABY4C6D3_9BACT|nr:hypothetical protein [Bdellovibrio reynosensis]UOF00264.1 hypothetical protein MNR06_11185 [Bdellovibrio reynosensis]
MKDLIKQNGLLKIAIFVTLVFLSSSLTIYLGFISIESIYVSALNKDLKLFISSVFYPILCVIFFGVSYKDFFGKNRRPHLNYKHVLMLLTLIILIGIGFAIENNGVYSFIGLAVIVLFVLKLLVDYLKDNIDSPYWEKEIAIESLQLENLIECIKKEFFIVKITTNTDSTIVSGFGLWSVQATVKLYKTKAIIRVHPMNSAITFFLFLKIMPAPLGKIYGNRLIKKLNI